MHIPPGDLSNINVKVGSTLMFQTPAENSFFVLKDARQSEFILNFRGENDYVPPQLRFTIKLRHFMLQTL